MRDASLIYVAAFLRSTAVGLIGVILAIALTEAGVSVAGTGLVIGAGLAGIAVMTAVVTFATDRLGRRRTLVALAALTMCGYIAAAAVTRIAWLLPAAFAGMLNGWGATVVPPARSSRQSFLKQLTPLIARGYLPGTTWCSMPDMRSAALPGSSRHSWRHMQV